MTVKIDISVMGYTFKGVAQKQEWVKEEGVWFVKAEESRPRKSPFGEQIKPK